MLVLVFDDEGSLGEVYSDRSDEDVRIFDTGTFENEVIEEVIRKGNLKLVYNAG